MIDSNDILTYRKVTAQLIRRLRGELIMQKGDRVNDKDIASCLGLTPSGFSLVASASSSLSGITFYKLLLWLISLQVDLKEILEIDLYFDAHPNGSLFEFSNDSCAPPTGANEAASGCPRDCLVDCNKCAFG